MQEDKYQPLYVGFYWTLPVRWRGFTQLSSDVEEAVTQSRTIRYQRALAKRHASANNGRVIDEIVYMEVDPDHGTVHVREALSRVRRSCQEHGAQMLWADFEKRSGWRGHVHINSFIKEAELPNEPLFPESLKIGIEDTFDPVKHFRDWRLLTAASAEHRRHMIELGLAAALESIPLEYGCNPKIAYFLNERGILTQNGKQWTPENVDKAVKKFIARPTGQDALA